MEDMKKQMDDLRRITSAGNALCFCGDYNCSFADNYYFTYQGRDTLLSSFAENGLVLRYFGMRPLSRYAQTYEPTEADLIRAARVAYLEAGAKNEAAYRAVLCVLYNRCIATRFGGGVTTISEEVYRKSQFSVIHNKRFKTLEPPEEIVEAARDIFVYGNLDLPENVLFFCAARLGKHFGGRRFYKNIGGNLFFYGKTE